DLLGVEHGILPEDEALVRRTGLRVCWPIVGLPEHHGDAVFALADAPPGGFHLLEGGPEWRRKAHRREEPDIDAAIGALAEEVAGQPKRAVPGLLPGNGALLQ